MKKKLFGSLGEIVKNNAVLIILTVCVIAAGALSFYTVNDINSKLKSQQPQKTTQEETPAPQDSAQDVQNNADNVPLKPTPAPTKTPAPVQPQQETTSTEKFVNPVDGQVFNAFSRDELVYNKTMDDWRTHNGVDIRANKDTAVKAGAVTAVYQDGMLGNVVEIKTDGYIAKYCGLGGNIMVSKGDSVKQGQTIGLVGEIPLELSEESHLHLEFIENALAKDPVEYLG